MKDLLHINSRRSKNMSMLMSINKNEKSERSVKRQTKKKG